MSSPTSSLQKLLAGMPAPNPPQFNEDWDLERYQKEMVIFHQKLLEYVSRLMHTFTARNIVQEVIQMIGTGVAAIQYDTTTKQLQIKTFKPDGTLTGWTMITGGQAVEYP